MQGRGAGTDGERIVDADRGGEGGFKRREIRAEHQVTVPDRARRGLSFFLPHCRLRQPNPRISHLGIFPSNGSYALMARTP